MYMFKNLELSKLYIETFRKFKDVYDVEVCIHCIQKCLESFELSKLCLEIFTMYKKDFDIIRTL